MELAVKLTGFSIPFKSSLMPRPASTISGAVTRRRFSFFASSFGKVSLIRVIASSVSTERQMSPVSVSKTFDSMVILFWLVLIV